MFARSNASMRGGPPAVRWSGARPGGRVAQRCEVRVFHRGDRLANEGEPVAGPWLMLTGAARAYLTGPDHAQVAVRLLRAPASIGEVECLEGATSLTSLEALEKTAALHLPRSAFLAAV